MSIPCRTLLFLCLFFVFNTSFSQDILPLSTHSLILTDVEQAKLRTLIKENSKANQLYKGVVEEANHFMDDKPAPLSVLHYEGMLDTDSARILTEISISDMAKVNALYYASYGKTNDQYGLKIKEFVLAWARSYIPDGNTINENKFVPLFWGYYLFKSLFSKEEQTLVEDWMMEIVSQQIVRPHTPNNNWQSKRLRMIGLIGGILNDQLLMHAAIVGMKEYINTSLYADGTSIDLKTRDALSYHASGLKPLITMGLNLSIFNPDFDLYDYVAMNGGSIKKSVEYMVPYITGEKIHKEWVNTQVQLDKERAAAGIEKYQPGKHYDPLDALPLFEYACFYNTAYYPLIADLLEVSTISYTLTWESMLNSPLVRE